MDFDAVYIMSILYLFIYLHAFGMPYCVSMGMDRMDCSPSHEIKIEQFENLADLNAFIRKNGIEGTVVNMTDGHIVKIKTQPVYKTVLEEKRVIDYYRYDVAN
jgi:hypothetical protein